MRPWIVLGCAFAMASTSTAAAWAQSRPGYYYQPGYYYYSPGAPPRAYARPPCAAVTPGPLRGAARGAAGGAIIGAITGNAGRGAAIGAGIHGVANIVRRNVARSSGNCY
jgi:OmpA family protein